MKPLTLTMTRRSGRRTAGRTGRTAGRTGRQPWRVLLVCVAACRSFIPGCLANVSSWTCGLDSVPFEDVPWSRKEASDDVGVFSRRRPRLMRSAVDLERRAFGLSSDQTIDDIDSAGEPAARQRVRRCTCAIGMVPLDEIYYCPLPTDRCTVWSKRYSGEYRVECFKHTSWKVGFARCIWFYLCFAMLLLVLYPIFTKPGQPHAVRYLLSKCFSRMNPWIADHLLDTEIEEHNLISNEFERYARLERRTEGWISEYRVKTKYYSSKETDEGRDPTDKKYDDAELGVGDDDNAKIHGDNGADSVSNQINRENPKPNEEDEECVCTICILPLEDGDRVADLPCRHLYHVDCLSEWILKKNSCPLCHIPAAKEIRSFETDPPTNGVDDPSSSGSMLSRWRNLIRESFLDVITGRDRRVYAVHRARMRHMLEDSNEA